MTDYSSTILYDAIQKAIESRKPAEIEKAQRFLTVKCHQEKILWLELLFDVVSCFQIM